LEQEQPVMGLKIPGKWPWIYCEMHEENFAYGQERIAVAVKEAAEDKTDVA
jgi:hypothetical protein